jgi:crotonobetainyl-CoA:carnitine CoA-transferase CaiB-like acyl-CoA transferase
LGTNRNKRSVTCDIATPEGQALIRQLVMTCHVFIENFKVGDMARYGLDFASLSQLHPSLVYCSITGFGQTGPYRERAGYDYAVQGIGGLMSITGERDDLGGGPQKVGVAVADLFTGMYASVGILAALRHAEATGQGQHVDMALLDTQVAMLANLGANYLVSGQKEGKIPGRSGNAHQNVWHSPKSVDKYDVKTEMENCKCNERNMPPSSKTRLSNKSSIKATQLSM